MSAVVAPPAPAPLRLPAAGAAGAAVRAHVEAVRAHWHGVHARGGSGAAVAAGLADALEACAVALFEAARRQQPAAAPPMALVALGGLARREVAPFADLDLLLVSPDPDHAAVRAVADGLFYPLWDARLEVGHAVRAAPHFAELAQADETVRTAAVDHRALAGDAAVLVDLTARLRAALASQACRRAAAAAAARAWAQVPTAASVYCLQPDLKAGPGGLREAQQLWWMGRLLWQLDGWGDLQARGLLDPHRLTALLTARGALLELRLALHFVAGRRQEQLRFEWQDEVAEALAVPAGPGSRRPADNLLESFFRHASAVRHATEEVLERAAARQRRPPGTPRAGLPPQPEAEGFALVGGRLTLRRADQIGRRPTELLRLFRVAQRLGVPIDAHARARVAREAPRLIDADFRADRRAAQLLVDIFSDPSDGGAALTQLHALGALERLLPEMADVVGLAPRDLYHVHTVDVHLVACARCALRLLADAEPAAPAAVRALASRVRRPHVLVLAAFMHDIGKGHGHGHSERGAKLAARACGRLGLDEEDTGDVAWLVQEHLTMFRISQRRDLEDDALIGRFAASCGSTERLDLLMVLSYADAVTTGPEAWTEWKAGLLLELHARARAACVRAPAPPPPPARLQAVQALAPARAAALAALAARLPPRHLAAHRADLLLRHLDAVEAAAAAALAGGAAVAVSAAPHPRRDGWELVVCAPDRPGLLADLTGVLAAWGTAVDAAQISGSDDGLALDTFVVGNLEAAPLFYAVRREALLAELHAAAAGTVDFAARLGERQRAERRRQAPQSRLPTRVVYDLDADPAATVVDLFAPNRAGLLHRVTGAIFAAGASIVLARVGTEGERAVDAFYLVDAVTRRPLDAAARDRVAGALTAATA